MKVYIKKPVEKELPESSGKYMTELDTVIYTMKYGWHDGVHEYIEVQWWLKEIDLSELMEEFAEWTATIFKPSLGKYEYIWRVSSFSFTTSADAVRKDYLTTKELINQFLTEKGYITENIMDKAINNASKKSFSKTPKKL